VVPVTLVGASQRMRSGREWAMSAGEIVLVVHPPIASDDAQELCDESYKVIKESLVAYS
jgi:1-acyl-sn-glycerol-3-phosphate acyltransferase